MSLTDDRSKAAVVSNERILTLPLNSGEHPIVETNYMGGHYHRVLMHPEGVWLASMTVGAKALHMWRASELGRMESAVLIPSTEYFSFSPDGRWFAICWDGKFQFYRVGNWESSVFTIERRPASNQHGPVAFARQSGIVAVAASRYTIQLLRLSSEVPGKYSLLATLETPDRIPLEILAFSPDGKWLAAATTKLVVQLWNLDALRDGLAEFDLHHDWPDHRQKFEPTPQKL
jgi:WD40 repeat protein